ncbi:ADP-sugar pyrophosphatase [Wickerhamomyces ciferrii]|uniref:ADP-sugar pyrophosphatase n=1 Tax=Wickerhamomyces ciferrii (strain ATCC 14091 / BCRC 22168 / CBS 111 / JCM 3599 / NBRC 0793 / NRRL Y-1031 F-60-10) TaxID=1206466 RepID=K0KTW2_WICCF|nr:ADP-sugar pyrophosphatase [Wickerhamomyces ciferrii]CCH46621.1 ADP-sugar pyrophosphatase [Wickerhamomyces ciferrii]
MLRYIKFNKSNLSKVSLAKTLISRSNITTMVAPKESPEKAKIIKTEPLASEDAKWTKLERITYADPTGKERLWESASRSTRPQCSEVDAVAIIAILEKPEGPEIVLQRQFRPPTGGVCIEVPAGLVDPNESIETTALRELKEETGYIGKVISRSPVIFNDPGFCSTNLSLVTTSVDLNDERNKNPQPELEDGEFIETFSVPIKNFDEQLKKLHDQGYKIDSRVQNIAEGIKIAQQFRL